MNCKKIIDLLKQIKFHGVTNFPSIGKLEGYIQSTMMESGYTYEIELDFLTMAEKNGLEVAVFTYGFKQLEAAIDRGFKNIVFNFSSEENEPGFKIIEMKKQTKKLQ
jgi:predicted TIM-barrel enzyme